MSNPASLRPADPADLEQALAHALQFDGRKAFRVSREMMAKITAAHLVGKRPASPSLTPGVMPACKPGQPPRFVKKALKLSPNCIEVSGSPMPMKGT